MCSVPYWHPVMQEHTCLLLSSSTEEGKSVAELESPLAHSEIYQSVYTC